jgi:hypothetical protein
VLRAQQDNNSLHLWFLLWASPLGCRRKHLWGRPPTDGTGPPGSLAGSRAVGCVSSSVFVCDGSETKHTQVGYCKFWGAGGHSLEKTGADYAWHMSPETDFTEQFLWPINLKFISNILSSAPRSPKLPLHCKFCMLFLSLPRILQA